MFKLEQIYKTQLDTNYKVLKHIDIILILISLFTPQTLSVVEDCGAKQDNSCVNKSKALCLKIIVIVSISITSMIGVCLLLVTRSIQALSPERSLFPPLLFVIVKAFAAGIILVTGFMHVLPDSFDMLSYSCLKENPWHKFPFTGFVTMLSAIFTLAIDSIATSLYSKKHKAGVILESQGKAGDQEMGSVNTGNHVHDHHHHGSFSTKVGVDGTKLLRYRVMPWLVFSSIY
ncbi:probable zinc transporter 10 [Nicotiana sylvestris]|uniref:probable zinc transporter 10 n=1 Tax=Nicotiana sylvestris TaxID=4096 RepID=UPI00388C3A72